MQTNQLPQNQHFNFAVKTEHVKPPISFRGMDWRAIVADSNFDEGPIGYGPTEQEAVDNLLEQLGVKI